MSVYKAEGSQVVLNSNWTCGKVNGAWKITSGPEEATQTVEFPVQLPSGAIVAKAWINAKSSTSPLGGIQYFRINGEDVPASGECEISVSPGDTSVRAVFAFKGWGAIVNTEGTHYGMLRIDAPTLYVDYVDTAAGESGSSGATASTTAKGLRLPRLLDADMKENARLRCVSLSIVENIDPLSTAEMTLPHNAPAVEVDDFVELFTPYGSAGVYRVYKTAESVQKHRKCALRHGIVTLADDIVTEGNAIAAPVAQVFASLLAMQSYPLWVMGECETPPDLEMVLERNHQSILHAFTDLTAKLPDGYAWEFDQASIPWRVHLRAMPADDTCEFRMSRDIVGMTINIDRDSQCTRVYAFGAGEGDDRIGLTGLIGTPYLDAEGIENRRIIAKSITNENVFDALTLKSVAEKYLERHKDPTVSIEVDAANIYRQTGLTMDKFHLGKVCRVPLPALGRTIREKVISIRWRDLIKSPDSVTATLANRLRNVSDEMADLMREATNGKLIGGTVVSKTNEYNNSSVTQSSSLVHEFDISGYGNVLTVQVDFTPAGKCLLLVDSEKEVPASEAENGSVDILRYLRSDENGVPIVGKHNVQFFAIGTGTIAVHSEVTVKTIEKRGGGTSAPVVPSSGTAFYTSDGLEFTTSDGKQLYVMGG